MSDDLRWYRSEDLSERLAVELRTLDRATADDVADALRAAGATGWRFSVECCPLATYLRWRLDPGSRVSVYRSRVVWRPSQRPTHRVVASLPPAARLVTLLVDRGYLPDLVRRY